MPNYEGPCAMILATIDGDELARSVNADAVKKYFVKNIRTTR